MPAQRSPLITFATIFFVLGCVCVLANAGRTLLENNDGPICDTVVDLLKCDYTFGIIKEAIKKTDLTDALTDPVADITIFVPTNAAFADALKKLGLTQEELLELDNLADILKYHVIKGKKKSWRYS